MSADDQSAYLEAASTLLGLPIQPEHRDDVLAAFAVLSAQSQLVTSFILPEETEPAPRFTP